MAFGKYPSVPCWLLPWHGSGYGFWSYPGPGVSFRDLRAVRTIIQCSTWKGLSGVSNGPVLVFQKKNEKWLVPKLSGSFIPAALRSLKGHVCWWQGLGRTWRFSPGLRQGQRTPSSTSSPALLPPQELFLKTQISGRTCFKITPLLKSQVFWDVGRPSWSQVRGKQSNKHLTPVTASEATSSGASWPRTLAVRCFFLAKLPAAPREGWDLLGEMTN